MDSISLSQYLAFHLFTRKNKRRRSLPKDHLKYIGNEMIRYGDACDLVFCYVTNGNMTLGQRKTARRRIVLYSLWVSNGKRCYLDGKPVDFSDVNRDHVYPACWGYGQEGNVMPARAESNSKKGSQLPTLRQAFRAWRAYRKSGFTFCPCTRQDVSPKIRFRFHMSIQM